MGEISSSDKIFMKRKKWFFRLVNLLICRYCKRNRLIVGLHKKCVSLHVEKTIYAKVFHLFGL